MNKSQNPNPIKVGGAIHHLSDRSSKKPKTMFEFSIQPSQIPEVLEQLRKKGGDASWVVFMFYTPRNSIETDDDCPNLQFSVHKGKVGLDWVLLGPRNIADKVLINEYITSKGYKVKEKEINEVPFLRVKKGDMATLGLGIVEDFYKMPNDADVGLLISGFSLSLGGQHLN
ncbi:MAG: hypothetical protein C0406_08150 [Sideroxydans sp.]|nr:hypothetical protein [Sideroxydans sp.]